MAKFESVDDYLASLDPPKGDTLRAVIDVILDEFPDLECKLAWNVPQVHRGKEYVFGVSAAKHHLSLSPWSSAVMAAVHDRLVEAGYDVTTNLFKVPIDWDVDHDLIVGLVNARLDELG